MKKINGKSYLIKGIMTLAMLFATLSTSTACFYVLHQPKVPESLRK
ncbi:MAG: cyclic lactone autoinducer peptide [Eubacteriaceae bacterium]